LATSRKRKEELLQNYQGWIGTSSGFVLTSYAGLSVKEFDVLRRKVREAGGEFQVVKNSLIRMAFRQAGVPLPEAAETGTTAVGYGSGDVAALAKAIVDAARETQGLSIKGSVISGVLYSAAQTEKLADLPPLPVLRAQLVGLIQTPAGRIAGAIGASVRQLAQVIHAYGQKGSAPAA
jgi:large subunit ribosomal protein L10